jgi:hypothetical protein
MQRKMARSAPPPPFGPPGVAAVIRTASLACQNAVKAQKFVQLQESSEESRLMSIVEFQLHTLAFLAAQRNALRAVKICRPAPSPEGVLLDKVEFGNNTIRHNVDENFSVFFDSLKAHLAGVLEHDGTLGVLQVFV